MYRTDSHYTKPNLKNTAYVKQLVKIQIQLKNGKVRQHFPEELKLNANNLI